MSVMLGWVNSLARRQLLTHHDKQNYFYQPAVLRLQVSHPWLSFTYLKGYPYLSFEPQISVSSPKFLIRNAPASPASPQTDIYHQPEVSAANTYHCKEMSTASGRDTSQDLNVWTAYYHVRERFRNLRDTTRLMTEISDEDEDVDELSFGKEIDDDYLDVGAKTSDLAKSQFVPSKDSESDSETFADGDDAFPSETNQTSHEATERQRDDSDSSGTNTCLSAHEASVSTHHFSASAEETWDDVIDNSSPSDNDGRSQTRTGFDPRESPDKDKWRRLNSINDGVQAKQRGSQNRYADRQRWIETFCGRVGMVGYQRERTRAIIESINMKHMAHYSTELVILGAISLVARESNRQIRRETAYQNLLVSVGGDRDTIVKIKRLLWEKSNVIG